MQENPERTKELMTDTIEAYLNVLKENKNEKPIISEKGKVVLKCLQDNQDVVLWKAKDIAERINSTSRGVSGTMRKLVSDGFCESMGANPIVYKLTEKGKNFKIVIEGENN